VRSDLSTPDGSLAVLRKRPEWPAATARLAELWNQHHEKAEASAAAYGDVYKSERGTMVFDVVVSRQQQYSRRVTHMIERWNTEAADRSLRYLADNPPPQREWGLRSTETATLGTIATNLVRFAEDNSLDEDAACRRWADSVSTIEHAPKLDPIVGAVPGIGIALFAYLRMRSGAVDALKPDIRVFRALRKLGYQVPNEPHAILVTARGAAAELGSTLLALDQLLWDS
jgi:hypothetical protein